MQFVFIFAKILKQTQQQEINAIPTPAVFQNVLMSSEFYLIFECCQQTNSLAIHQF